MIILMIALALGVTAVSVKDGATIGPSTKQHYENGTANRTR